MTAISFATLGISEGFVRKLKEGGVSVPTPVQEKAIPILLEGEDLIAQAQTGTGKTLAFALPILQTFDPSKESVQALIVTPTRELALQITTELRKLASLAEAQILAVYGGQDVEAQSHKLKGNATIVVCTPGRLLDHMRRGTIDLSKVRKLVLDEADQMLHMGFLAEVEAIIEALPRNRQTMLFSATMPDGVKRLARSYMNNPRDVRIAGKQVTLEEIKQFVVETTDRAKQATLFRMLDLYKPFLAVIFCRTKIRARKLTEAMQDRGYNVDELHGDLTQSKREQVMERFRKADLQYLVATDVAARGLDVEGVTHVFNYDIALDPEWYIHRIGRTGRAKQTGTAITLVAPKDRGLLARIEEGIGMTLKRRSMEEFDVFAGTNEQESDSMEEGGYGRKLNKGYRNAYENRYGSNAGGRSGARGEEGRRSGGQGAKTRGEGGQAGLRTGKSGGYLAERPARSNGAGGAGGRSSGGYAAGEQRPAGRGGAAAGRPGKGGGGRSAAPGKAAGGFGGGYKSAGGGTRSGSTSGRGSYAPGGKGQGGRGRPAPRGR